MLQERWRLRIESERHTTARRNRCEPSRALLALALVLLMGLAALAGPAGLVGSASAQAGNNVIDECGTTLTDPGETYTIDQTLTSDNPEPYIDVTADNVTIDGQGNELDGDDDSGEIIHVNIADNVTIENLDLRERETGIYVDESDDTTIQDVELVEGGEDFQDGIVLADAEGTAIRDVSVTGAGQTGIYADHGSTSITIEDTAAVDNGEYGVNAEADGLTSTNLTVEGNGDSEGEYAGLRIGGENQVHTDLTARNNDGDGVSIVSGDFDGSGATIQGAETTVSGNGQSGVYAEDVHGVTITDGEFIGNGESFDAGIELVGNSNDRMQDIDIQDVTIEGGSNGIEMYAVENALIENPEIADIPGDGIHADESTLTIRNAEITNMSDHGVSAVDGGHVTIEGNETLISENGWSGVFADTNAHVDITGGTISDNEESDLRAVEPGTIDATNVNVGDSTAADTTLDVEVISGSVSSVDEPPPAPDGQVPLGRYIDLHELEFELLVDGDVHPQEGTPEGPDPPELTLQNDEADLDGLNASTLSLWHHDGEEWNPVADGNSGPIDSLGVYGLFAEPAPEPTPEPDDSSSSGPTQVPNFHVDVVNHTEGIEPGDSSVFEVNVENSGDGDGTENVTVRRDGELIDSTEVWVLAGDNRTITFSPIFEEEGEYEIRFANQTSVTVTVAAQEESTPSPTATEEPTPTPTEAPAPDPTETPDDDDGGINVVLVGGLILVVVIAIGGGVWYYYQQ